MNTPCGVTIISAMGGYTMENSTVLMCALKENDTEHFQKCVLEKDPAAFIILRDLLGLWETDSEHINSRIG